MPQQSLSDFVDDMEKAALLVRITEEKRVDELVYDWGIYRSMFRTKNEKLFDMTCTSHRARLNAQAVQAKGHNLELAIVLGGPLVDKVAALTGVPPGTDDFEVLGIFYGHPAKLVKCETIDLLVPPTPRSSSNVS